MRNKGPILSSFIVILYLTSHSPSSILSQLHIFSSPVTNTQHCPPPPPPPPNSIQPPPHSPPQFLHPLSCPWTRTRLIQSICITGSWLCWFLYNSKRLSPGVWSLSSLVYSNPDAFSLACVRLCTSSYKLFQGTLFRGHVHLVKHLILETFLVSYATLRRRENSGWNDQRGAISLFPLNFHGNTVIGRRIDD